MEDFAYLFGTSVDDFDSECLEFIEKTDFRYNKLSKKRRDETILEILKKIDSGELIVAGKQQARWENGWSENLQNFISSNYNLAELVPKYVKPNRVLRLYRDYIMPVEADFELNFFTVLRLWLFKKYLKGFNEIYEFGCGSGYNLALLARLFPEKKLYGLDWAKASVEIVNLIAEKHKVNAEGRLFNMFSPDYNLNIGGDSAIITIGGLEQLGENYQPFVQFIMRKSLKLCIHMEPFCELYDENNLVDYLAIKFDRARNYLAGFLTSLRKMEIERKIQILKTQRVCFGSLYHDGWSLVIWRRGAT